MAAGPASLDTLLRKRVKNTARKITPRRARSTETPAGENQPAEGSIRGLIITENITLDWSPRRPRAGSAPPAARTPYRTSRRCFDSSGRPPTRCSSAGDVRADVRLLAAADRRHDGHPSSRARARPTIVRERERGPRRRDREHRTTVRDLRSNTRRRTVNRGGRPPTSEVALLRPVNARKTVP